ncbi:MAG: hypothetical protein GXW89_03055 [Phycisphaerae bacterium]|nr:hypothetical protein [Phycisphaerae bacterium]
MIRRWVVIAFCVIPHTNAFGHGYAKYASTPITPPLEFRWGLPLAALILLVSMVISFRVVLGHRLRAAGLRAMLGMALFAVTFYMFGRCAATASTAPPSGLGAPRPTYWGLDWDESGATFLTWNLIGVAFFLISASLLAGRKHPVSQRLLMTAIGVVAYAAALTPYLASGAYLHGWAGGYVHMECTRKLDCLTEAVCDYADAHGGTLPSPADIDDLIRMVQPYLKEEGSYVYSARSVSLAICPLGGAFERAPQKYQWNAKFSGGQLVEINEDALLAEGLITCPYHKTRDPGSMLRIMQNYKHPASRPASSRSEAMHRLWHAERKIIMARAQPYGG